MKPYSAEMRRDVLDMAAAGMTTQETFLELQVSKSWIRRVKQEFRETGKTAPKMTRQRTKDWEQHIDWLCEKVQADPGIYLRELKEAAAKERQWQTSLTNLSKALRALKLTRKKRR